MHPAHSPRPVVRRAFSIIELLVVLFIVGVLIAIIVPTLGNTRDAAKRSDTESFLAELGRAIDRFQNDKRRLPGYFTAREMGDQENLNRGMSAAENMMLDLAGGAGIASVRDNDSVPPQIEIGPTPAARAFVNMLTWGRDGAYISPPTRFYTPQLNNGQQVGAAGHTDGPSVDSRNQLPDLIDSFGTPILAWMEDPISIGKPDREALQLPRFAAANSSTPAKFYWASNAAFLRANNLGKKGANVNNSSLLGSPNGAPAQTQVEALTAILGNPAFPDNRELGVNEMYPTQARGKWILHSGGRNGVYMGRDTNRKDLNEPGASLAEGGTLWYGLSIKDGDGNIRRDRDGRPTSLDLATQFDDVIVSGG